MLYYNIFKKNYQPASQSSQRIVSYCFVVLKLLLSLLYLFVFRWRRLVRIVSLQSVLSSSFRDAAIISTLQQHLMISLLQWVHVSNPPYDYASVHRRSRTHIVHPLAVYPGQAIQPSAIARQ